MQKLAARSNGGLDQESQLQLYQNSPSDKSTSTEIDKHDIGFLPVDIRGRPLVRKGNTGTWKAASFILATEMAERMTYIGLLSNAVSYLVFRMHLTFPKASELVTNVAGASNLTPLLGAFMADAYLGRFWTILVFGIIYLVGLVLLVLVAFLPSLAPSNAECTPYQAALGGCEPASEGQLTVLYLGLYIIAVGTGGITPCVSAFGADQFDEEDPSEMKYMPSYFNAFYFFISVGSLLSLTLVVNVSDSIDYKWGFFIMLVSMFLALVIFLVGTPRYRHRLPSARLSPLTRIAQVTVASARKMRLRAPANDLELYEVFDKESAIVGSRKIVHTSDYRFLDKAAVPTEAEKDQIKENPKKIPSPWKLCTVTQVEEVKALLVMMPIWCTGIITNMAFIQIINFALQGGTSMNREVAGFDVPVPTLASVATILVAIALPLYNQYFVPFMSRITGDTRGISLLQRQGVGQLVMTVGLLAAGVLENRRRAQAWALGKQLNPLASLPISGFWNVPIFSLIGLGEVFAMVGQMEFFYDQAPDAMRSVGIAIFTANGGIGAYMGSALVHIINKITPEPGWVAVNINLGHMDYYYFFVAVLNLLNFFLFLWFAHRYKYKIVSKSTKREAVLLKALHQENAHEHANAGPATVGVADS